MWKKIVIWLCPAKLAEKKCIENSFQKREVEKKLHCMLGKQVLRNIPFLLHWKSHEVISFDEDTEKRMKKVKGYFPQTLQF